MSLGMLAAGWATLVCWLLWSPPPEQPGTWPPWADKAVHAALFLVQALLGRAFAGPGRGRTLASVGVVMALGTEVVQGLLPWPRTPDVLDALADLTGYAAGLGLFTAGRWTMKRGDRGSVAS